MTEKKVVNTYLAIVEKSVNNEIQKDTTIALKEYDNGTYELIVSQNNTISRVLDCNSKEIAEIQFHNEQIKHFGKIVQNLNER
jgi:uncharacterized ubiquitin-like protein YukD